MKKRPFKFWWRIKLAVACARVSTLANRAKGLLLKRIHDEEARLANAWWEAMTAERQQEAVALAHFHEHKAKTAELLSWMTHMRPGDEGTTPGTPPERNN